VRGEICILQLRNQRVLHGSSNTCGAIAMNKESMNEQTRIEIEAAVFRRLLAHLDVRSDVQNIDLMTLAGFCRNCLAKWYSAAANERGASVDYDAAREVVYGMPYDVWKSRHQKEASPEQLQAFADKRPQD
jgi:uncharacterized protein